MKDDRKFYVYVLFRPWDGSPFYVGKGQGRRWDRHWERGASHPNLHLRNIIKKSADLGLEIPRVKIRQMRNEQDAFEIEVALIAAIGRGNSGPLVNLTDCGEGRAGYKASDATRAKIRTSAIGNKRPLGCKRSDETREKLRARVFSQETRAKMSAAKIGKKLSAEHREKLSMAKKGKILSPSHRKNIGLAHLGKKRSEAARENMRRSMTHDPISGRLKRRIDAD